ncbi:hypothetical protein [Candidiatus Paracoxiella cheracis]|uniref:hypothetical protein n=1 Tax=Candidiatus Paracoxiella cheracis TaxID=3405120 RepID=UPI003BF5D658
MKKIIPVMSLLLLVAFSTSALSANQVASFGKDKGFGLVLECSFEATDRNSYVVGPLRGSGCSFDSERHILQCRSSVYQYDTTPIKTGEFTCNGVSKLQEGVQTKNKGCLFSVQKIPGVKKPFDCLIQDLQPDKN